MFKPPPQQYNATLKFSVDSRLSLVEVIAMLEEHINTMMTSLENERPECTAYVSTYKLRIEE